MKPLGRLRLGVNIDHVATVRNARGSVWPEPLRAALLAEAAGADGITAHLREDRRHITDPDIEALSLLCAEAGRTRDWTAWPFAQLAPETPAGTDAMVPPPVAQERVQTSRAAGFHDGSA